MEDVEFKFDEDDMLEFNNADKSDDDIKLVNTHTKKNKKKVPIKRKKVNFKPVSMPQAQAQSSRQQYMPKPQFEDTTFESFSNPQKRVPEMSPDENDSDVQSEGDVSGGDFSGYSPSNNGYEEPIDQPAEGFESIEEEKEDLLYKFHRLESRGMKLAKKFNIHSDIKEMRAEYSKIKKDSAVKSSIKFSRQLLMMIVNASEFLNKRYDPFGFELDGWSETVNENLNDGDYDSVFERLHDKYAGRVNTPPEIELMLSLAGSAVMFHMTSSMFKSVPNIGDLAKNNPDIQKAMKSMAEGLIKTQMDSAASTASAANETTPQESNEIRREMRGPSINLSGFGDILPPPMPSSALPPAQPRQTIRAEDISDLPESLKSISDSEMSGISVKQVSVVTEGGTKRGRKPKISATKDNTIDIN